MTAPSRPFLPILVLLLPFLLLLLGLLLLFLLLLLGLLLRLLRLFLGAFLGAFLGGIGLRLVPKAVIVLLGRPRLLLLLPLHRNGPLHRAARQGGLVIPGRIPTAQGHLFGAELEGAQARGRRLGRRRRYIVAILLLQSWLRVRLQSGKSRLLARDRLQPPAQLPFPESLVVLAVLLLQVRLDDLAGLDALVLPLGQGPVAVHDLAPGEVDVVQLVAQVVGGARVQALEDGGLAGPVGGVEDVGHEGPRPQHLVDGELPELGQQRVLDPHRHAQVLRRHLVPVEGDFFFRLLEPPGVGGARLRSRGRLVFGPVKGGRLGRLGQVVMNLQRR
ncbi:hypothetical protein PG985_002286 [Apiospora marii]|uniref:uncharacterized protein n=1 Tax=Apiospora marii TaxID=335849 RepID=UPI003132499C